MYLELNCNFMYCINPGPAIICLEAIYKDIRLLGDTDTSDLVVKCVEDRQIGVHSLLMMAPVF